MIRERDQDPHFRTHGCFWLGCYPTTSFVPSSQKIREPAKIRFRDAALCNEAGTKENFTQLARSRCGAEQGSAEQGGGAVVKGHNLHIRFNHECQQGAVVCVEYSADRSRAPQGSTGNFCGASFQIRNTNKFKHNGRTNLSVQFRASTAIASISAISRSWRGLTRRKRTSRTSRAAIRAHAAAGLLMTTSRRPKCSVWCSARS